MCNHDYISRSEAEQALVTSLINAGHDFDSVLALLLSHPCAGKFTEIHATSPKQAIGWLKRPFDTAHQWAATHESPARQSAAAALAWAMSSPWPGNTGTTGRAVFIAHATIAHKAGRLHLRGRRALPRRVSRHNLPNCQQCHEAIMFSRPAQG